MKATFAIVKRLLASNKISFIIMALVVLCATSSGDVVLSNGNYTWLLAVSDDEQVHIQYSENSKEYYEISVSDGNVLTMVNASNKEWTDYIGGKPSAEDRKIVLQVPTALLDTVTLSTTNEDVSLPVLAVTGSIDISTNGGNITFESLDVGNTLTLTAKNGDISGTVIGSYDDFAIQSEIKKGDSNLPDNKDSGDKTLKVSSNNGDVNIEFVAK